MKVLRGAGTAAVLATLGLVGYRLVVTGELTLDTGVRRTVGTLGPIDIVIAAPREVVFDVIAQPDLGRTPRRWATNWRCSSGEQSRSRRPIAPPSGLAR